MRTLKEMVAGGAQVYFAHYQKGELWYHTECGFEFPVPIDDTGDGIFLAQDKAMLFMRYIRKHIDYLNKAKEDHVNSGINERSASTSSTGPQ